MRGGANWRINDILFYKVKYFSKKNIDVLYLKGTRPFLLKISDLFAKARSYPLHICYFVSHKPIMKYFKDLITKLIPN